MKDYTVENMNYTPIPIGFVGENEGSRIIFPIDTWLGGVDASKGSFTLVNLRSGDTEPYPVTVTNDQENVYWAVSSTDLESEGYGQCELTYTLDDTYEKSVTFITRTFPSLSGNQSTVTPTPAQSWVDQVIQATGTNASNASASATAAAESAESARQSSEFAVRVTSQSFTDQQQKIARENIGANNADNIDEGILSVAHGGTGASTADEALENLGAIAKGGNAGGLTGGTYTSLSGESRGNTLVGGYWRYGDFIYLNVFITAGSEWAEGYSWKVVYNIPKPQGSVQGLSAYVYNDSETTVDSTLTAAIFALNDTGTVNIRCWHDGLKVGDRIVVSGFYYSPLS